MECCNSKQLRIYQYLAYVASLVFKCSLRQTIMRSSLFFSFLLLIGFYTALLTLGGLQRGSLDSYIFCLALSLYNPLPAQPDFPGVTRREASENKEMPIELSQRDCPRAGYVGRRKARSGQRL